MTDKVYIISNGNQAPWGIGEVMEIMPMRHRRKILAFCQEYHNQPTLRLNSPSGPTLHWEHDKDDKLLLVEQ